MRGVLLAAVTLVLAGCISVPGDSTNPASAVTSPLDPILVKHDHFDPAEHAFALNMEETAWFPLAGAGKQSGAHVLDVNGDTLLVGANNDDATGFSLFDVSEPASPKLLGSWHKDGHVGDDRTIMFSADGKTVFVGSESDDMPGVYAVDVTDPASPKEVAFFENKPYGSHTIYAAEIDGQQYVYIVGLGLVIVEYDAAAQAFSLAGRYLAATPGQLLAVPNPAQEPGDAATYAIRDVYGHDVWVEKDEETGQVLAYIAYAYEGLKIVDVTTPAAPREVGTFIPGGDGAPWYVHTIAVTRMDDRRIAVVGSEVFENRHVEVPSPVWIVDVTDLAQPELLATWTNPGGHGSDNLLLSAHDLRIQGERLYLSHYHAGVWVLDLAKLVAGDVDATLGYALPNRDNGFRPPEDEGCCFGFNLNGGPITFDVLPLGDVVYAADLTTGLYAYRYTGA